jgi:hypothetical protein
VAPDPPCVWPMNFSTLFIHPPQFFFSFSPHVQPSTGALTNRKTEPTDEFIIAGEESKNKSKNKKRKI